MTTTANTSSTSPSKIRRYVAERDGMLAVVRSMRGDESLVEFDVRRRRWVCSGHGARVCDCVSAATLNLPLAVALRVAAVIAPKRKGGALSAKSGGAKDGESANQRALAEALARSASERAERVSVHDSQHEQATAAITTRQMTDADRTRLAERRAAKRRSYSW
ncbi:hypothetical protein [Nocardioides mangrovi]|uniref:Transposase n=1 Tax=Nocardioides mangrovi TaxID=2874580 RepID=A0ABS7U953_9ACTN|nr:hypothetical protein [Nocardioides mangrovi]MBZ5737508.1 hypothetical protein [Nocardioides mangrovi]